MNEKSMMLLTDYSGVDPTGWWLSEKLDGCRAYWDGLALWTRSGNVIPAPAWFTARLPAGMHLDGELWAGRGSFSTASTACRGGRWSRKVRFKVFDAPGVPGAWLDRINMARLAGADVINNTYTGVWKCNGANHLQEELERIVSSGGEGIVLRRPGVWPYRAGRSSDVQRLKPGQRKYQYDNG